MIIGVPKEIKPQENRVAIQPGGVMMLVRNGHEVLIEKGAGLGSGFNDYDYTITLKYMVNKKPIGK